MVEEDGFPRGQGTGDRVELIFLWLQVQRG